jgi:hypothetical protein
MAMRKKKRKTLNLNFSNESGVTYHTNQVL